MTMYTDAKILIVEDEEDINRLIELMLISAGYHNIQKAFDGKEALEKFYKFEPDLVLLDVMLPELDGFEVCKEIKSNPKYKSTPIIMLTAKKMEEDVLKGFESGAVDYVTKPFSNKILLARIKAHLTAKEIGKSKTYANLTVDKLKHEVRQGEDVLNLTHFEYEILTLFISNVGRVFSRSKLLEHLRGVDGFEVSERAVDVQILNLRRKLGNLGENIETVRGVGYKLKELTNE